MKVVSRSQVGLLTCLCHIGAFPGGFPPVAIKPIGYYMRLTAAGTVPDSHRFPHLRTAEAFTCVADTPLRTAKLRNK